MKRGHSSVLEGSGLREILEDISGEVTEATDRLRVSHGAITELTVWTDGKFLHVAVNMDKGCGRRDVCPDD
ncbi:MAG: DUF5611 family protein [Thermoplasmata archaeon]